MADYGPSKKWMHIVHQERDAWQKGQGANRLYTYRKDTGLGGGDWCSVFVNWVMRQVGYGGTGSAMAESWTRWGTRLHGPQKGAICVLDDGIMDDPKYPNNPYFHVTFLEHHLGSAENCVGGNQSGMVNYSMFGLHTGERIVKHHVQRVVYVWPPRS